MVSEIGKLHSSFITLYVLCIVYIILFIIFISTSLYNNGQFSSLIDNILSNAYSQLHSGTICYYISDHLPIFRNIYNKITKPDSKHAKYNGNHRKKACTGSKLRYHKRTGYQRVATLIQYRHITTSFVFFTFTSTLAFHYEKYSNCNKPKHDWCTPGIVKSCKTNCKLYKSFISNRAEIMSHTK